MGFINTFCFEPIHPGIIRGLSSRKTFHDYAIESFCGDRVSSSKASNLKERHWRAHKRHNLRSPFFEGTQPSE